MGLPTPPAISVTGPAVPTICGLTVEVKCGLPKTVEVDRYRRAVLTPSDETGDEPDLVGPAIHRGGEEQ